MANEIENGTRYSAILSDRPGTITLGPPNESYPLGDIPSYAYRQATENLFGKSVSREINSLKETIETAAARNKIPADLVRAVAYNEHTNGKYDKLREWAADVVGNPKVLEPNATIRPMNVNSQMWGRLLENGYSELLRNGYTPRQLLQDPKININIGADLLGRIAALVLNGDIAKIATLYNGLGQSKISYYGQDIERIYHEKPWTKVDEPPKAPKAPGSANAGIGSSYQDPAHGLMTIGQHRDMLYGGSWKSDPRPPGSNGYTPKTSDSPSEYGHGADTPHSAPAPSNNQQFDRDHQSGDGSGNSNGNPSGAWGSGVGNAPASASHDRDHQSGTGSGIGASHDREHDRDHQPGDGSSSSTPPANRKDDDEHSKKEKEAADARRGNDLNGPSSSPSKSTGPSSDSSHDSLKGDATHMAQPDGSVITGQTSFRSSGGCALTRGDDARGRCRVRLASVRRNTRGAWRIAA